MISQDVLHKVTGSQEGHGQPIGFYLLLMPLLFWPMSLYFTATFNTIKHHFQDPKIRFLLAWIMPNWIIYELIPTKLVHYLMPIFPAIALLIAVTLMQCLHQQAPRSRPIATFIEGFMWLLYNTLLAGGILYASISLLHNIAPLAAVACGVVILNTVIAYACFKTHRPLASLCSNVVTAVLVYGLLFNWMFPDMALLWNSKRVATILQLPHYQQHLQHKPLLVSGYQEPSLIFEVGTKSVAFVSLNTIEQNFSNHIPTLALLDKKHFSQFKQYASNQHIKYHIDAVLPGYDLNHGHHITLTLLESPSTGNKP
jgi:4-amino-4-deoxy-L-arabinose transferase-like glycosyltransferase